MIKNLLPENTFGWHLSRLKEIRMEKLMIFDTKSKTIYQGYWKDSGAFAWTDDDSWDPFKAFNLSLEDAFMKGDDYKFLCSCGKIENASNLFSQVLMGIINYNVKHPSEPFESELIITTLGNLKKMYKENSYLNETDEVKAFKSFSEHNPCADNSDFFMAGIKWARALNAKDV